MAEEKKLYRNTSNKMVAGVSSGLAEYSNMDVTLMRLLVALVIIITFPLGLIGYIVMAAVIPEKGAAPKQ